ncbi:TPA: hypothetical protein SAY52_003895 [Burkholderia cenocepacia]|uniref:hypothetical protein n=1 Tax=unclassified Burkholderia TaxID=2613784 RepID=UPI00158AF3BF|nr:MULTISPECIES: hypothetical protein [unclassified Burkholderia]HEF5873246.1 hypothetical protein [Burkholderia cenocepacia]
MSVARRLDAALRALLPGRGRSGATATRDAPAAWGRYAQHVAQWLQTVLDGDDAAASRLRADVERWADARADAGDDGPVLPVRAWLDRRGRVTRVDCAAAGQTALGAALHAALAGREIGLAPPRGMTQPLVLRVTLAGAR